MNLVEKYIFKNTFLHWGGNQVSWSDSIWLYLVILGVSVFSIILMCSFRTNISLFYEKNKKTILNCLLGIGVFLVLLNVFRSTILVMGGYPNEWEAIPLHLCRFLVIVMSVIFITKKIELLKYIAFFTILSSIFGLAIPGMESISSEEGATIESNIGFDSYIFWDFVVVHNLGIVLPTFFLISAKPSFSKRDVFFSILGITNLFAVIFVVNYLMCTYIDSDLWKANWFYVGPSEYNYIAKMMSPVLGPLGDWPFIWITFWFIGFVGYFIILFLYFALTGIYFVNTRKIKEIYYWNIDIDKTKSKFYFDNSEIQKFLKSNVLKKN